MKYLTGYNIFTESSKNVPIQELQIQKKLGIVLLGIPCSGKSTFAKSVINKYMNNVKTFSTDKVSLLLSKDPNKYQDGASELNIRYLKEYIKTGQNFVYDTTGGNEKAVYEVCNLATDNEYKIIFILLLIDKATAKKQNTQRGNIGGHLVDAEYIDYVYSIQNKTTKDFIERVEHDNFYIVLIKDDFKYKYFKHKGDSIHKRKVDRYIPLPNYK